MSVHCDGQVALLIAGLEHDASGCHDRLIAIRSREDEQMRAARLVGPA
jgi:hypothetical protein